MENLLVVSSTSQVTRETELRLAQDLKDICNKHGKEIYPEKSGEILHKLGLIYRDKTPDKISLIQSATLFNAAIARQPGNMEFRNSLAELCSHVLQLAKAADTKRNLVKVADGVADRLREVRAEADAGLKDLNNITYSEEDAKLKEMESDKIQTVKKLQDAITKHYTETMAHIAANCELIMGKSPCRYAISGMGSLARKEITPYSDFEHVILIEDDVKGKDDYEDILEYFRWFSLIFHVIVINLKETIVPSVTIPSLNDASMPGGDWFFDTFTTRGVSFDGLMPHACKFPLGRSKKTENKPWTTELIQPISEMVNYLDDQVDLKNGYHLGDILTRTCFVSGDQELYDTFANMVRLTLNGNKLDIQPKLMRQLSEDLDNFDAFSNVDCLHFARHCNIKRVIYRSTSLFLLALGRLHAVNECSCFDIIDQLGKKSVIDSDTAHSLSYAIAVACQVRLKVYMYKGRQDDCIGQGDMYNLNDDNSVTSQLVDIVGNRSIVDYFVTAFSLQQTIRDQKRLQVAKKFKITSKPHDKFMMLYLLNLYDQILDEWVRYSEDFDFLAPTEENLWIRYDVARAYRAKGRHGEALQHFQWLDHQTIKNHSLQGSVSINAAWCLFHMNRFEETVDYIHKTKIKVTEINALECVKCDFLSMLTRIEGLCKYELNDYEAALQAYESELQYLENQDVNFIEIRKAGCLKNIAECHLKLKDFHRALEKANEAHQLCKQNDAPATWVCDCFNLLGRCHFRLGDYEKALKNFHDEEEIRIQFVDGEKRVNDKDIKIAKRNIQACHNRLGPDCLIYN